jgi:Iap family predicted aminopeptidase
VILTAHYDRVEGSPGANDNSAAVFHLLKAAQKLREQRADYWIIIFTDKEELSPGEGIQDQGAFSLAQKLKAWGLGDARVFNFDACGSGDTFIFSSTTDYLLRHDRRPGLRRTRQSLQVLREQATETARFLRLNKVLSVPTPFSDEAGFLRAGIPAQTITMLPTDEAVPYASLLRKRPDFADILFSDAAIKNKTDRLLIPETWRCINSPLDSHLRLTPEFYDRIVRFAVELCRS